MYVPILKAKQGEKDGLLHLTDEVKDQIVPLFELPLDTVKSKEKSMACVTTHWKNREFFLDFSTDCKAERFSVTEFFEDFNRINTDFSIPVFHLNYSNEICKQLASQSKNEYALRVTTNEVMDDDFEDIIESFFETIPPEKTFLIVDVEELRIENLNNSVYTAKAAIETIPSLNKFKKIIVASCSFPKSFQGFDKHEFILLNRLESKFFNRLSKKLKDIEIIYSDYCINHCSDFEFVPGMQPSFNIRYTTKSEYLVYKGETIKKGGLNFENINEACKKLCIHPLYMGFDYSWGDSMIYKIAHNEVNKGGNLTSWRAYGTNHHITFMVNQLSSQL
ncbi:MULTISPECIES: beta family protein [Listeria]|uniref:beta family protein n=1 Tax=Listeria TaxID=1637 RepID=UPI000B593637|nr:MULTISPECIES: beta family protein [Listeria]